jgi:hypothetical protein
MKSKSILSFFLIAIVLGGTGSSLAIDKDEYVASVLTIIRTHVNLLEELSVTSRFKYSDNLVRHAVAVQDTFSLLGPMEWHAAEAAKLHSVKQGSGSELNEDMFESLARASRKSMTDLVRAAHDSMENYERDSMIDAINTMKQSCNNCHILLPKSVAPDIWGPLNRE